MSEPDQNIADRMRSLIAELVSAAHRFNVGETGMAMASLRSGSAQLGAVSARAALLYGPAGRPPVRKGRKRK